MDMVEFPEPNEFVQNVLNFLFDWLIQADRATRHLGEEDVKESIKAGLVAARQILHETALCLPADDVEQRMYAQSFLDANGKAREAWASPAIRSPRPLVFDTANVEHDSYVGDDDGVILAEAVAVAASPLELQRVAEDFNATEFNYTEQDLVHALGWVKVALSDVQNILFDLDEDDLGELAQITLIGMRIALRMAKNTHRTLSNMCGVHLRRIPVRISADGPADNGAGPRTRAGDLGDSEFRYLSELPEEDEGAIGEIEGRGVLPWDPLTPRLVEGAQKLVIEGQARPVTAAFVVAAALPFSGVAVCVGAPVLACDAGLQWGASTPVGRAVGQSTLNAVELGKLWWVAGKLVTKQTLRLARRELDRVGGPTGLACCAAEGACWTATHPIEAAVTSVGLAGQAGKAVYGQVLWVADLLATIREEATSS